MDRNRIDGAARGGIEGLDSYQGRLQIHSQQLELRHYIKLAEIFLVGSTKTSPLINVRMIMITVQVAYVPRVK